MISAKKKRIVDVKESTRKPTGEYESSLNPHTSGIDPSFWQFLCVWVSWCEHPNLNHRFFGYAVRQVRATSAAASDEIIS